MVNAVKLREVSSSSSCRLSGCQGLQIINAMMFIIIITMHTAQMIKYIKGNLDVTCWDIGQFVFSRGVSFLLIISLHSTWSPIWMVLRKVSKGIKLYWTFYFILRLYLTVKRHNKAQMSMCPLHIFNVSLEGSFLVQIITKRIFIHQCNTKHSDTSNTIIITNIILLHQKNGNCLKFNFRFIAKIAQSQSLLNYGNDPMSVKKLYFAVFGHSSSVKGREREDN